jgi:hypothetical protein
MAQINDQIGEFNLDAKQIDVLSEDSNSETSFSVKIA